MGMMTVMHGQTFKGYLHDMGRVEGFDADGASVGVFTGPNRRRQAFRAVIEAGIPAEGHARETEKQDNPMDSAE
jgi:hypothetical protein